MWRGRGKPPSLPQPQTLLCHFSARAFCSCWPKFSNTFNGNARRILRICNPFFRNGSNHLARSTVPVKRVKQSLLPFPQNDCPAEFKSLIFKRFTQAAVCTLALHSPDSRTLRLHGSRRKAIRSAVTAECTTNSKGAWQPHQAQPRWRAPPVCTTPARTVPLGAPLRRHDDASAEAQ